MLIGYSMISACLGILFLTGLASASDDPSQPLGTYQRIEIKTTDAESTDQTTAQNSEDARPPQKVGPNGTILPRALMGMRWETLPGFDVVPQADNLEPAATTTSPLEEVEDLSDLYFDILAKQVILAREAFYTLNVDQEILSPLIRQFNEVVANIIRRDTSFFSEELAIDFADSLFKQVHTAEHVRELFLQAATNATNGDTPCGSAIDGSNP